MDITQDACLPDIDPFNPDATAGPPIKMPLATVLQRLLVQLGPKGLGVSEAAATAQMDAEVYQVDLPDGCSIVGAVAAVLERLQETHLSRTAFEPDSEENPDPRSDPHSPLRYPWLAQKIDFWATLPLSTMCHVFSFLPVQDHFSTLTRISSYYGRLLHRKASWPATLRIREDPSKKEVFLGDEKTPHFCAVPAHVLAKLGRLGFPTIDGGGALALAALANPHTRVLRCSQEVELTEAALAPLDKMTRLQDLELGCCTGESDSGLIFLRGLSLVRLCLIGKEGLPVDERVPLLGATLSAFFMPLKTLRLAWINMTDTLCALSGLPLCELDLLHTNIKDEDLGEICSLPLERLSLRACPDITVAAVEHLSKIITLQELSLAQCMLPMDDTFAALSVLPQLKTLDLSYSSKFAPSFFIQLAQFPGLQELDLRNSGLSDNDLPTLVDLKLTRLVVRDCHALSHSGFSALGICLRRSPLAGALTHLDVSGTTLSDVDLKSFSDLSCLQSLDLRNCKALTETGLASFSQPSLCVISKGQSPAKERQPLRRTKLNAPIPTARFLKELAAVGPAGQDTILESWDLADNDVWLDRKLESFDQRAEESDKVFKQLTQVSDNHFRELTNSINTSLLGTESNPVPSMDGLPEHAYTNVLSGKLRGNGSITVNGSRTKKQGSDGKLNSRKGSISAQAGWSRPTAAAFADTSIKRAAQVAMTPPRTPSKGGGLIGKQQQDGSGKAEPTASAIWAMYKAALASESRRGSLKQEGSSRRGSVKQDQCRRTSMQPSEPCSLAPSRKPSLAIALTAPQQRKEGEGEEEGQATRLQGEQGEGDWSCRFCDIPHPPTEKDCRGCAGTREEVAAPGIRGLVSDYFQADPSEEGLMGDALIRTKSGLLEQVQEELRRDKGMMDDHDPEGQEASTPLHKKVKAPPAQGGLLRSSSRLLEQVRKQIFEEDQRETDAEGPRRSSTFTMDGGEFIKSASKGFMKQIKHLLPLESKLQEEEGENVVDDTLCLDDAEDNEEGNDFLVGSTYTSIDEEGMEGVSQRTEAENGVELDMGGLGETADEWEQMPDPSKYDGVNEPSF
eukprot:gb/GEZN01000992.1/.p1 GENE.gb/GEZN01000992.1/~~gb/GEZN01000992.1/.p1  ORF type:complete len:1076 (+),score=180.88 gb/GEZN01000992.1/:64-3291(+)